MTNIEAKDFVYCVSSSAYWVNPEEKHDAFDVIPAALLKKMIDLRLKSKNHFRSPTDEKPCCCMICNESFTNKSNLEKHSNR